MVMGFCGGLRGEEVFLASLKRNVYILGGDKVEEGTVPYNEDFEGKVQGRNMGEVAHSATSRYHGLGN